jgi:hypothetical protein
VSEERMEKRRTEEEGSVERKERRSDSIEWRRGLGQAGLRQIEMAERMSAALTEGRVHVIQYWAEKVCSSREREINVMKKLPL